MHTIYKQCAHCGAPIALSPILRPHSPGGTLWSDGYLETSSAEPPVLGKCRACGAIGCLTELPTIESTVPPADEADCGVVPLILDDYALLLDNLQEISARFHLYLRIQFWHLNNHRRRGKDDAAPLSDGECANLIELLQLLGDEDPNRVLKAEILRQLQEFEGAKTVLNDIFSDMVKGTFDERFTPIVERLRLLIADRNAQLVTIDPG